MGQSINDLYKIIHLYRQFPRYDKMKYQDLVNMILPSFNLEQYQLQKVNGEVIKVRCIIIRRNKLYNVYIDNINSIIIRLLNIHSK